MLIRKPADIRPSEITSKDNYLNRRDFIRAGSIAGGLAMAGPALSAVVPDQRRGKLADVGSSEYSTDETMNSSILELFLDTIIYSAFHTFGRKV